MSEKPQDSLTPPREQALSGPAPALAFSAEVAALMAGLTHEGRNILQRGQAALERLHWRLRERGEALDLLDRVQRSLDDLVHLFEAARDFTSPTVLKSARCDLAALCREAWQRVTAARPRPDARLIEDTGDVDLCCEADPARLGVVFQHLLASALAACPDPARVEVVCRDATLAGWPAVQMAVRDNGPALGPEQRQGLFEPFAGPRARRFGLGLALVRKIVEAHGGQVAAGPGVGGEILVTLPRRMP